MNKREFLALGGAVPLMLAGCGGGNGSASVRLINASVGPAYATGLGFMVNTSQATSQDVPYGKASPFETVSAGSVTTALTQASGSSNTTIWSGTRTLNKNTSYDLIAYGFNNELRSVLLTESTTAPNSGTANVNVLNTSADIGPVDVYVSPGTDLTLGTQIASSVGSTTQGVAQSLFYGVTATAAGTPYYITVVGAGSVQRGVSDVRFQTPSAVTLTDQQIMTVILTPGTGGTLANAILLTQGGSGGVTSFSNATSRVRVINAVQNGSSVAVTAGTGSSQTTLLASTTQPGATQYFVVPTGTAPNVSINGGAALTGSSWTGGAVPTTQAGFDYTLMVYTDAGGNVVAQLVSDDNTAPSGATGVKFRLINMVPTPAGLQLSMSVNSLPAAYNVPYPTASSYQEIAVPQTIQSTVSITNGATQVWTLTPQVLQAGRIFTAAVVGLSGSSATVFFLESTFAS